MNESRLCLAGGCFWGVEAYFRKIDGITSVMSGYANGKTETTTYEELADTDHAETVLLEYDPSKINMTTILAYYLRVIDPTSLNRQGNDVGRQYRTGIYYFTEEQKKIAELYLDSVKTHYKAPIVVEVQALDHFIEAEPFHQDYLGRNPEGYCHINLGRPIEKISLPEITEELGAYKKMDIIDLEKALSLISFKVTQENATEAPFKNEYEKNFKKGIYVDITSGEPLFLSADKFESGCGWPAFSRPIADYHLQYHDDYSKDNRLRIEVRSQVGDAHLGHVFNDGPKELGGLRYCINSAALRFIPVEEMEEKGYGKYIPLLDEK